jgi:hypothetical protein
MILTREEISNLIEVCDPDARYLPYASDTYNFARAIEAAIIQKIGEPVAWSHNNGHIQCDGIGVPSHLYTVENGWTPLYAIPEVK